MRLAFVGQATFFEACALGDERPDITTTFIDFRKGLEPDALLRRLEGFAPDVVVMFRPEIVPDGLFAELDAVTLGFLTEPLPRPKEGGQVHEDLERRLWELSQVDAANFDRVVAFDPYIADTAAQHTPVWRSLPLPVADRYFRDVTPIRGRPRPLFVGRSTPHREWMLEDAKHATDLLHLAFGVDAGELERLLAEHDVGVNIHNQPYLSFENRVCLHLAAGHLVVSEGLSPAHGLEAGIDFLEFDAPGSLLLLLDRLARFPGLHHGVRVRGRRKAEQYRASRVYPRVVSDLLADVAAFGSPRRRAAVH